MIYDCIIVGGGAAGLYAASQLAYRNSQANTSLSVCVLEKSGRPGSKILVTGSGQCNITHGGSIKDFIGCYGDHGKQVRKVLYGHNNSDVISHFNMLGVRTFEREDGKVFPASLSAEEVRKALENHAQEAGFDIMTMRSVTAISVDNDGVYNIYADSSSHIDPHYTPGRTLEEGQASSSGSAPFKFCYKSRSVIIACGGMSYPGTGSDGSIFPVLENLGLEIVPVSPALVPIHVNEYPYKDLSGVSINGAELRIEGRKPLHGDLLFTHNSLSGPLVINNSRYMKPGMKVSFSYLPGIDTSTFSKALKDRAQGSKKNLETLVTETCEALDCRIPKRLIELIVERAETALNAKLKAEKASSVSGKALDLIAKHLTNDQFTVNSLASWNQAMCTAGGVSLSEIDLATMESKKYPHLFIIGETLDIDGDTGGYNLQFAFSSAYAAVKQITNNEL
ncbi:MAG: aminoacetone oxidase family FAD-binding enzyme [Firmicutes bacterium]|nr:aminoacetone oxidase family FAD-binding enzyme [Bacillota bacterium]